VSAFDSLFISSGGAEAINSDIRVFDPMVGPFPGAHG
jgi:hypothetical protein